MQHVVHVEFCRTTEFTSRPVDDGPREDVFLGHGLPVVARAVAGDVARAFVEVPINLQPIPQTLGLAGKAAEGKCERRPCGGLEA